MSLQPGIHEGISADRYHSGLSWSEKQGETLAAPSLSSSIAKLLISKSPAHARAAHPMLNPHLVREEDTKFDIGTAAHALLLEGSDIIGVVDADSWRTKDAKRAAEIFRLDGRIPLLPDQAERVYAMVNAAYDQLERHTAKPQPFTDGKAEQTLVWDDDGVLCRARLDWLSNDQKVIDDYKSTNASAHPAKWERTMYGMNADLQVAFYMRGVEKLTGVKPDFRFVVQETYEPYALSVIDLAPSALALAEEKVALAQHIWLQCIKSGDWPAYSQYVASIEVPTWEEMRWLERDQEVAA